GGAGAVGRGAAPADGTGQPVSTKPLRAAGALPVGGTGRKPSRGKLSAGGDRAHRAAREQLSGRPVGVLRPVQTGRSVAQTQPVGAGAAGLRIDHQSESVASGSLGGATRAGRYDRGAGGG